MNDDSLLVLPWVRPDGGVFLTIILSDGNLERIRSYDPAEINFRDLPQWAADRIVGVGVTYATAAEAAEVEALARAGRVGEALRLVTRGYRFRPERGDAEDPV